MRRLKYHPHNSVLWVTFSLEKGLLLLSNPLCQTIITSCLAAAQEAHPVKISMILVEATHVHLIMVVINPEDVPGFMRYFKVESAHMLNRLIGRKGSVWCEGYDSPIVLTPERTLTCIAYGYGNPAKDNLEESIDEYPGFSSWQMFRSKVHTKRYKRVRRDQFQALPRSSHNLRGYTKEAERVLAESKEFVTFTLEPNAWMNAFGITDPAEQERTNNRIVERVREIEERSREVRRQENKRVIGREKLLSQVLDPMHQPQRFGRRMWCLSEIRSVRVTFIRFFKGLMAQAREVLAKWRTGDMTAKYPPGLHPPSMPILANAWP